MFFVFYNFSLPLLTSPDGPAIHRLKCVQIMAIQRPPRLGRAHMFRPCCSFCGPTELVEKSDSGACLPCVVQPGMLPSSLLARGCRGGRWSPPKWIHVPATVPAPSAFQYDPPQIDGEVYLQKESQKRTRVVLFKCECVLEFPRRRLEIQNVRALLGGDSATQNPGWGQVICISFRQCWPCAS